MLVNRADFAFADRVSKRTFVASNPITPIIIAFVASNPVTQIQVQPRGGRGNGTFLGKYTRKFRREHSRWLQYEALDIIPFLNFDAFHYKTEYSSASSVLDFLEFFLSC
ncbi:hypothetical protein AVEN_45434-1 [Araneus ventricosus]|uniref:Uncharacterized protein n=1 Tax=Araneus ventricosus TaxID=182803 RepID=A0A4Y2MQ34_ARAVE|nr:hypothetical protein AVEN_45434-1 [Araneus ventricosus]